MRSVAVAGASSPPAYTRTHVDGVDEAAQLEPYSVADRQPMQLDQGRRDMVGACCCGADAVRCSNRTTKFRTLFNDLMFVRVNPYLIPERYFLHVRRLLAEPTVIPEVTVDWCAPPS